MAGVATYWRCINGDGLVYNGPCVVKHIIFEPVSANDYVTIYDDRSVVAASKFVKVICSVVLTWSLDMGDGVEFGRGVYVDGIDGDVYTTIGFVPLEQA